MHATSRASLSPHQSENEIVTIQIGQCGSYIGQEWLKGVLKQHHIDDDGIFNPDIMVEDYSSYTDFKTKRWTYNEYMHLDNDYLQRRMNAYFYEKGRGLISDGFIRQKIESYYSTLSHIPHEIKTLCKQYTGSVKFKSNRYRARAIFIDSDPSTIDEIRSSTIRDIFNPNNFLSGSASMFRW